MFDGVTDSIIVPQGAMSRLGKATTQGTKSVGNILGEDNQAGSHGNLSGALNNQLCIEAWVVPDCGGVVVEKEGQFRLKIGDVDTPGPAVFEVYLNSDSGTVVETLSTAKSVTSRGYEGTVYPPAEFRGIHDSYNRYDGSSDDATSLNIDHRPLIHIVATVRSNSIDLYINGVLMVQKSLLNRNVTIANYDSHLYVGGKGGKFRGVMEALHISSDFSEEAIDRSAPLRNENTLLLYRFEEPIAPISGTYKFSAIANNSTTMDGATVTISQITITTTDAITLAKKLTGLSTVSGNYVFSKDSTGTHKYSGGDYKVVDYQQSTGTPVMHSISHTPYNLLINAGGIDLDTHKPNGKPPERVRLHNINTTTGNMLVSSIHLDFPNSSNGLRSALHTRTTGLDNHFVVIGADLLIDNATGKPYQDPHFSTQIIDRTGQMVIDESPFAQHGFVYSSNMANTTDDSDNPFAVVWPATVDTSFQIGHSGRHILNHVDGHEFLRMLPRANEEIIDQRIDGSADLIDIIYDVGRTGAGEQISVNSRVDIFREQDVFEINKVVNSSRCEALFNNGLTKENKELLAIGGVNFDYKAFMLKGPVPDNLDNINAETRRHHLRPSEESRVAILHVPALSTYDLAPFVKIYYNAIDLTGASMSGTIQPLLMVEKTVPAGTTVVTGTTTIYELIKTAVTSASITATLYAPGGYIEARFEGQQLVGNLIQSHSLVGDTSEGYESDDELDESLTPINYKPLTPTGITVSGNQNAGGGNTITTTGNTTGNVNIAVDDTIYTSSLVFVGIIASIGNDITLDENRAVALINGEELYVGVLANINPNTTPQIITASHSPSTSHDSVFHRIVIDTFHGDKNQTLTDKGEFHRREPSVVLDSPSNGEFDKGVTSSNTHIHEMFDIIDNGSISGNKEGMRLFIQPSDRRRVNQLAKIRSSVSDGEEANFVSLMYLMSRARVRSVKESDKEGENFTSVHCVGLSESTANRNVSVRGKGSPDSHIVKEIEPNAPVVTVTLGGPGQGAMDTKPTFDPSPLARLPFSTRRNCATLGYRITTTTNGGKIYVKPLNNEADDLASWGTYGFPMKGRVYLEDGSNALYDSKDGDEFVFTAASAFGDGKFLLANGTEFQNFFQWLEATETALGAVSNGSDMYISTSFFNDEFFDESSLAEDGTTVNDRMFQTMNDVSHDYQLGTQYASTRAIVEIPFFANQFFDEPEKGILPGPDNSFKIHVDATQTAHTYNPSPVGRRHKGVEPADREARSSFTMNKAEKKFTPITRIDKFELVASFYHLHPDNSELFHSVSLSDASYQNVGSNVRNYRKVFLANGEWAYYEDIPLVGTRYLKIPNDSNWGFSSGFVESAVVGAAVSPGGPSLSEGLIPIGSDSITPSSDFENRGEYYHDSASAKTQGGNVDYGIRQYVSAVEFKAGPESNPHAPKVMSGRATGVVTNVEWSVLDGASSKFIHELIVTMSDEDMALFPDLDYDDMNTYTFSSGEYLYQADASASLSPSSMHYYGRISKNTSNEVVSANTLMFVFYDTGNSKPSWVTNLPGNEITLTKKTRSIFGNVSGAPPSNTTKAANNEIIAKTFKPAGDDAWTISASTLVSTCTITNGNGRLAGSNTISGLNLREGDSIYSEETASKILHIGTVSHIEDYDDGTYTVTLTGSCQNDTSSKPLRIEMPQVDDDEAILNKTWNYPYAPGGLRSGDTIWANMSMNNPHSIEGLFSKSRGVLNEALVWTGFNGGKGALATRPRESIPLENFLIGDTCLETAQNYAQHVNKTVEENYKVLGLTASQAPKVAYVDPYLSEDGHARVLLYDVAHDREFVAFQDLHMQVQTSADAVKIGWPKKMVIGTSNVISDTMEYAATLNGGGPSWLTTQIDVANGFPSENPYIRSVQQSKFIESAYAHDIANSLSTRLLTSLNSGTLPNSMFNYASGSLSPGIYGKAHGHHVHDGYSIYGAYQTFSEGDSVLLRTNDNTVNPLIANPDHSFSRTKRSVSDSFTTSLVKLRTDTSISHTLRDPSTFFDTPDGTRVIPAFLCLKGKRANALDLTSHSESRLQHLKQWTDMDFVRRLTVDCGSVAQKDGVVSVKSAALEIVRQINQAGAPKGQIVVDKDTTGSAHDPTAWWDSDKAFSTRDRGTHMGYVRAHIGREVQDKNGNIGFTVVIHSTVPGASGRNFCVWLDNSKGQSVYQPEFLIGHGGRWRNFWALPEEKEGENMHPAPMPLNKHGRPFAPVTTLTQYVTPEDSGEDVVSNTDFVTFDDNVTDADASVLRGTSHHLGSGKQFNTVNTESFETEGSSSVLVEGLRVGKRAIGRVNFGGLVASGIPGWAPDAGVWGFGKKGSQKFRGRYGSLTDVSYTSHTNSSDLKSDVVGNSSLYGLQFEDHRGGKHGLRFIYRTMGEGFANENTTLPDTISNEVCVFIDDRDVGLGGFTMGKHMYGSGDASGRLDISGGSGSAVSITDQAYCGNRWRGVSAPSIAVNCTISKSANATSLTVSLERPFQNGDTCAHHDILGYLGFPLKNGVIQITDSQDGKGGMTFSYTHRTQNNKSGPHTFFGIKSSQNGDTFVNSYLISPLLNWTTIVTDELLAVISTAAINADDSDINNPKGLAFDCREMYATDGRTFGEWGVAADAIIIRSYDTTKPVKPLSDFFYASFHRDMGIQAAHIELGEVEKTDNTGSGWAFGTSRALSNTDIKNQKRMACGYIPDTVLQIITRGRGPNTNTATPLLVDSFNNPVDTNEWRRNLKGESFTRHSGDHILPMINNPIVVYDNSAGNSDNWDGTTKQFPLAHEMWNFLIPAGEEGNTDRVPSFGEKKTIYMADKQFIVVEGLNPGTASFVTNKTTLVWYEEGRSEDWPTADIDDTLAFSHFGDIKRTMEFDGLRSLGSVFSEPIVHFKGGKGSVDHSVPLFFGGGFSGVTLDINDGTMNDYSTFYTHPYANGPTGTSGIQNANEISTSFALLDCNAMFAFFPGAAFCNQHRGSILPPFFNKDSILSPDLSKTGTTINTGHPNSGNTSPYNHSTTSLRVRVQKPSPLILRFAHPTARYEDHKNSSGTSNVENKTTYIVFGPGQAFPFTQEIADSANMSGANTEQPHPGAVVTIGNTWSKVPVSGTVKLPNHIQNYDGFYMPESSTYQLARGRFHWRSTINWEPPQGKPNVAILKQGPESGRMYGTHFNADTATSGINDELDRAHPMRHCSVIGHGVAMAADMVFHMDGGYHPGGHWMDNQITFNPPHPKSNTILQKWGAATQLHSSAYRVAGPITTKVLGYAAAEGDLVGADVDMEYIIVDATRCQNGEELATVMGMAINTYPGAGALKAMGGTHMPSMGNSMRQDRYGWVEVECTNITNSNTTPSNNHITVEMSGYTANNTVNRDRLEQIPACGWLRTAAGGFAPYYAREVNNDSTLKVRFYIAPNRISGQMKFEDRTTWYDTDGTISDFPAISASDVLHVWSKAGVHRYNNEVAATRDHMCQTHFSGIVDAIDRTRPIGAAGWAGERYSYLNSLKVGTEGYAGGLGAWHPMLGFSPYGSASSAMTAFGNLPVVAPMPRSPESLPPIDGIGTNLMTYMNNPYDSSVGFNITNDGQATYARKTSDNDGPDTLHSKPPIYVDTTLPDFMTHPQGVLGRAFLVVSYECESALIAKYDRDGITALGDWLQVKGAAANSVSNPIHYAGTTRWDERFHGQDRFIAPANAGPNVEALVHKTPTVPSITFSATHGADAAPFNAEYFLHGAAATNTTVENAIPGLHKTGDMLFDIDHSIGSFFLEDSGVTRNVADDFYEDVDYTTEYDNGSTLRVNDFWAGDVNAYALYDRAPAKNFTVEQIVWKRMDGGNLSLPAINARGLGAVPWMTRVKNGVAYTTGEKIFGNVRFSFETTNSAMLPILQAQEIAHPQLASKNPLLIGNVLNIPNEEMQFEEITVKDDSGQEHIIEGGSPLGTIIRGFSKVTDREAKGMSPSLANSGIAPNLKIQLPDPNSIPGNIIVRSGFDRLQGYQNETMGSGGMMHADLNEDYLGNLFDNSVSGPRKGPTYEDHNWEHIDPLTKDSTTAGWKETTDNAPLRTSYEQHDRTLYFHVTKMGHSHTHRYPTVFSHENGVETRILTASIFSGTTLTVNAAVLMPTTNTDIFAADFGSKEMAHTTTGRRFIRIYNSSTEESVVASYTGISGQTFTGVVGDVDFTDFMAAQTITNLKVVPSYYIPAGSNRFFAARRLRDHAEVSGNSPDMAKTQYSTGTYGTINTETLAYNIYNKAVITPMPLPRMGHHFVTPTMPMLPGHWAHPVYQGLYRSHLAENASLRGSVDRNLLKENTTATTEKSDIASGVSNYFHLQDAEIAFGSLNAAPSGPSDIHGGAFTLMFESKLKNDGYGVLASTGVAGKINQQGGHTVVLEASGNYTLDDFFPDPARVGAYQIVIQPNTFSNQLIGYHVDGGSYTLTGQQVNTVIGRKPATSGISGTGAVALLLAQTTQADVRGCEIFINEVMLDINPDHGEQFTNIPPLLLYNPFGVEGTESPAFTRRTLPYHPKLFSNSTPGYTLNIPWWSIVHKIAPDDGSSNNFKHLTHHRLDNYYMMKRSTFGSIGVQLTIAGYPSKYPAIYSHVLQNTSINPKCIVKTIHAESSGTREITVDDASAFPETPQYGQLLEFTDADGNIQTLPYTRRYGLQIGTINEPKKFTSTTVSGSFWTKLTALLAASVETTLRLTHPYNNLSAGKVMTDTNNSIFTMILPQVEKGTRDTTALHIPDAYLCLWHYNLGRPHTFYSDSSRTWGNLTSDRAVDKKPYNCMPEHFETIHYQDSVYAMSLGPFDFRMKSPNPEDKDGVASTGAEIHAFSGYEAQGGTNFDSQKIMFSKFWPCGSRGGPLTSRLDLYTQASISWNIPRKYASNDFYFWNDEDGLDENYAQGSSGITFTAMGSGYSGDNRKYPYGWRIAVRQACNKPTWGILTGRGKLEDDASSDNNFTVDYASGPLVQHEAMTWAYAGGDTGSQSNVSYTTTYVGVMERQTNFAGMLGCDKPEWQVKYSEGRRMTRPFGTPIRTLLSNSNMNKDWWGEVAGKGIYSLAEAAQYYLVDWWGNERGEDVRRAPVRGFGIRPAWDCGDVYEYDRANNRTPHARIWNYGKPIYEVLTGISAPVIDSSGNLDNEPPLLCGRSNAVNNTDTNTMVDVFAPTHSMRIGDMGNGRGVRYPIQFNEDILTELSEPIHTTGLVLSSNTAEPPAVTGLLRPRNDVLQADEIPRGISARLEISEHGLLKPDAVVSDRVEEIIGTSPHKDAVSRNSPRIGIDGHNVESVEKDHIAINTEAHSLHTDRNVGQRTILHGCLLGGSQTLAHLDLTSLAFGVQPRSALRFSHTSNMSPLGGNYILETRNYGNPFDDTGWGYDGLSGAVKTTNPYQNVDFNRTTIKNNQSDKSIKWLLRPVRLLDKNHVEMFRTLPATISGTPQYNNTVNKGTNTPTDYFRASAGGKYGIYTYEVTTPRVASNNFPSSAAPNTNAPYVPVFYMASGSSTITPTSQGPKILGTEVVGVDKFDKTTITSPVTRLVMSENTLQHYRSDAPRRRQIAENESEIKRMDFSVKPRFSQALHPKGHKGDVTFNVSDHSGDAA
jgi:hypothetical protein